MARILSIDYGGKRTGLAVTDPLQIIVSGLDTVDTSVLKNFLFDYINKEDVEKVIIGYPRHKDDTPTFLCKEIDKFINLLQKKFASLHIEKVDESFSSHRAKAILLESGLPKKKRRMKGIIDKVSAIVILQEYLGHI